MRYAPLLAAGVLAAALAGCASAKSGGAVVSGAGSSTAATAAGCADAGLATKVTIARSLHMIEPTRLGALSQTQTDPAEVRALFRDFCLVLSHREDVTGRAISCPDAFGLGYNGTFYAGQQVLATYVYTASGCQAVSLTAAGKSQSALVFGSAAKAAPDLEPDMARALGMTVQQAFQPYGGTHIHLGPGAVADSPGAAS
jgi:hypothetical protein